MIELGMQCISIPAITSKFIIIFFVLTPSSDLDEPTLNVTPDQYRSIAPDWSAGLVQYGILTSGAWFSF